MSFNNIANGSTVGATDFNNISNIETLDISSLNLSTDSMTIDVAALWKLASTSDLATTNTITLNIDESNLTSGDITLSGVNSVTNTGSGIGSLNAGSWTFSSTGTYDINDGTNTFHLQVV